MLVEPSVFLLMKLSGVFATFPCNLLRSYWVLGTVAFGDVMQLNMWPHTPGAVGENNSVA